MCPFNDRDQLLLDDFKANDGNSLATINFINRNQCCLQLMEHLSWATELSVYLTQSYLLHSPFQCYSYKPQFDDGNYCGSIVICGLAVFRETAELSLTIFSIIFRQTDSVCRTEPRIIVTLYSNYSVHHYSIPVSK